MVKKDMIYGTRTKDLKILVDDITKLGLLNSLKCVSFVETFWSETSTVKKLRKRLDKNLKAARRDKITNLVKILKHYIREKSKVALFPQPKQPGPINTEHAETIRDAIKGTNVLTEGKITPSVSDNTKTAVIEWARILNWEICRVLEVCISNSITAIHTLIKETNSWTDLRSKLKTIIKKCKVMQSIQSMNKLSRSFSEFQETLRIRNETNIDLLETIDSILKFFKKINSHIDPDLRNLNEFEKLKSLCNTILFIF